MKMNFRNLLISNLITVIIIFVLLSFFDHSGDPLRNIIIVFVGFTVMTIYDFVRTRRKK
ncbi:sec-independent periplasmic protein translocation protein TatC [Streptococcus gallolyticus]|uniref:Sec-independent periplasmic protein translocation protein TatC n=1 Tax=Streptococcus gallolyticus TaxID=315405 RepID=A0A928AA33_9STRE|nr:sec-independent periplasmic protein translocation protein TatC [Streptococcus gallolyticus]MBE6164824.1 sec-independent periplasmic protein translocation protein TatC [Streptococcus gallolyticus]MCF1633574.1 sec-independent periplasmic protein translocation protein TatC [Streptococcus gallolyticus]MCF2566835.1 sec-independent periplasmic protein translocation protein TatC [Streptococcus pasteurianus]MCQ9216054.1 sec-independent periplasmic protein translocation protein TatC [Streptococcus ga